MIRFFPLLFALFLFSSLAPDLYAQNPFTAPAPEQERKQDQSFTPGDLLPGWIKEQGQKAMAGIISWQSRIRQQAGAYARQIRENPWGGAFWSYLGLAFGYGVIHALGPGHGKVFVSTYFLSRKARISQGILMGSLMSFLHVLSAIILVFLFYFVFKTGGMGSVDEAGAHLQKISAGLISLVGLFLAWKSLKSIFHGQVKDCACCKAQPDNKGMLPLCLAVGLVPCPGAALILFFSITLDILPAGMLAMFFLASGLALTTISFALASLFTRNMLAGAVAKVSFNPVIYHIPALLGAIFITFLGAVLFFNPMM